MWNLALQQLKTLFLHYYESHDPLITCSSKIIISPIPSAYCHETWQGGDLPWGASTWRVTWLLSNVVLWYHLTKTLYLHYYDAYGHQICQGSKLQRGSHPWRHMALSSHGPPRSRDKIKRSNLHYNNAYIHQIWQGGKLSWWAVTHKVTWPYDHVVFQDQVTN